SGVATQRAEGDGPRRGSEQRDDPAREDDRHHRRPDQENAEGREDADITAEQVVAAADGPAEDHLQGPAGSVLRHTAGSQDEERQRAEAFEAPLAARAGDLRRGEQGQRRERDHDADVRGLLPQKTPRHFDHEVPFRKSSSSSAEERTSRTGTSARASALTALATSA